MGDSSPKPPGLGPAGQGTAAVRGAVAVERVAGVWIPACAGTTGEGWGWRGLPGQERQGRLGEKDG